MRWRIHHHSSGRREDVEGNFDEALDAAHKQCGTGRVTVSTLPAEIQLVELGDNGSVRIRPDLSGQEVQRLMRRHHTTIADLAFRMGITQRRIREVRQKGIRGAERIRDWLQAITDVDVGPLPERYRIRKRLEECQCGFCGYPLYIGDVAYEYVGEVFCSVTCCRRSRRWGS